MKTHFLLIGFSCTGKTSLGGEAFPGEIIDSDKELLKWIGQKEGQPFSHVYEIYMKLGRDPALSRIIEAEEALIDKWASDTSPKIISLGPGFPLRKNWARLHAISFVVLFRRSPQGIYDSLMKRREKIFECCPEAKKHDNWDVGVIVDEYKREFSKEVAISNIQSILDERESVYRYHDAEVVTDNALQKLKELASAFKSRRCDQLAESYANGRIPH
jgi:shikimate kinase